MCIAVRTCCFCRSARAHTAVCGLRTRERAYSCIPRGHSRAPESSVGTCVTNAHSRVSAHSRHMATGAPAARLGCAGSSTALCPPRAQAYGAQTLPVHVCKSCVPCDRFTALHGASLGACGCPSSTDSARLPRRHAHSRNKPSTYTDSGQLPTRICSADAWLPVRRSAAPKPRRIRSRNRSRGPCRLACGTCCGPGLRQYGIGRL